MKNAAQQKLAYVANKLGFDPSYCLPTTRAIYDSQTSVNVAGSAYTFFDDVAARSFPDTNVSTNQFETNEALAVESLCLFSKTAAGLFSGYLGDANISIIIGSQVVVKDLPVKFANPQGTSKDGDTYAVIPFAIPVVIPPLVSYRVEVTGVGAIDPALSPKFGAYLYGMGFLINFKQSL